MSEVNLVYQMYNTLSKSDIYDDSKWTYMFRPPIPLPLAA